MYKPLLRFIIVLIIVSILYVLWAWMSWSILTKDREPMWCALPDAYLTK